MFWKKVKKRSFDRENLKPVIRASICTGEEVAGFKDIRTGKFSEIMLINDDKDLKEFLETYDITMEEIAREY
ncbi:MAG: aspartate dehydrogenase [Lachnospiraceae bacterium]|nr:aspartate dehydrogenase [Lachnospiraceae bacterium]